MSQKSRRHSGWVTPRLTTKNKHKKIVQECLEPQPFYDDWYDYRDGQRDWRRDRTKIKPWSLIKQFDNKKLIQNNFKLLKLLKRRIARKSSYINNTE